MMILDCDEFASPIGRVVFVSNEDGVCALGFDGYEKRWTPFLERRFGQFEFRRGADPYRVKDRLRRYFDGELRALDVTPVSLGGSPFQRQVWKELRTIPAGETRTYGQVAKKLGKPEAARAVGHANGTNPVSLIVPCHRVIGTNSLTGYGGGLERKAWLLRHEGAQLHLTL